MGRVGVAMYEIKWLHVFLIMRLSLIGMLNDKDA